ncbi:MAG: FecR domain-containing protein [Filimonas sp.]|nr:FecR domain-containing protein [Filimonas sp.]
MKDLSNDIINDLLVKQLTGELKPEEQGELAQWINADADNKKYAAQFALLWDESKKIAAKSTIEEDAAWLRFKEKVRSNDADRKVVKMRWAWLRVAVMVVVVAGFGLFYYYTTNQKARQDVMLLSWETTSNTQTDTLPDASVIVLNKNSKLSYPSRFDDKKRYVSLEGEAFFQVTPNKEVPFVIGVNDITVRVVGTSFNIRSVGGKTEVIVETGIVQVTKNGKTIELRPKEKVTTVWKDTALQKEDNKDELYQYYRSKKFVCNNTALSRLVEMLSEAYDAHITIGNERVGNLRLTTTFDNVSLDQVLTIISETFNISVTHKNNEIILQ